MLTELQVRAAQPREKAFRLYDAQGMYLEVSPNGCRGWRLKYRVAGREKRISLGTYPEVSLREARVRRDEARVLIARGTDPATARQSGQTVAGMRGRNRALGAIDLDADASSFGTVAAEWFEVQKESWAPTHTSTVKQRLDRDVLPFLRRARVESVKPADVLTVLRRVEARGTAETAKRIKIIIGQVMRYAVATGRAESDPTASLKGALSPSKPTHFAAPTTPQHVGAILRACDGYHGRPIVRAALQFTPLVFQRPGEIRHARWQDIDFEERRWSFTASKTNTPHFVPLSSQALDVLDEVRRFSHACEWVFPSAMNRKRPMSNNALTAAYKRMEIGDEVTAHGWRATARTLLVEVLHYPPEVVELQLAHRVRDPLGRAYNRVQWIDERTKMMQAWADALDDWRRSSPLSPD